ncbi:MAG: hypothetical protein ACK4UV_01200 [Ignavibacterium sp.]
MKKLLLFFSLIFLVANSYSQNQIISKLKQPPPNRLTISDLWELQLNNTTRKDIKGYVFGTLSEASAGLIAEGRSKIINIKPGNNTYSYNDFSNAEVSFTNNQYKEIFLRSGNAPEGDYTICVTVYNESDEVIGQENCIYHSVRLAGNITLVSPDDDAEVDLEQPVLFSWSPLPGAKNFNIKIVEVLQGQSPLVAIEQNRPLVDKNISSGNSFQLNTTELKSFLRGIEEKDIYKTFAWQVKSGESKSDVYVWKCCKSAMANNYELDSLEIVVFNLCESKDDNAGETQAKVMDDDCDGDYDLTGTLLEIFNDESFVSEFKKVFINEQQNGILCRIIDHDGIRDTTNFEKNRIIDHDGIRDTTNFDNKKVRFKAGAELADKVKKLAIGGGGRTIGAGQVTEILKLANRQSNGRNLLVLVVADNKAVLESVFSGDNSGQELDTTNAKMTLLDAKDLLIGAEYEESGAGIFFRKMGGKKIENIISNTFNNNDWDNITQSNTSSPFNLTIKTKNIPFRYLDSYADIFYPDFYLSIPDGLFSEEQTNNIINDFKEISSNVGESWWGEYKGTLELFRVSGNKNRAKEIDGLVAEADDIKRIKQVDNSSLQDSLNQRRRNAEADLYGSARDAFVNLLLEAATEVEKSGEDLTVIVAKQIAPGGKCPPEGCGCEGDSREKVSCGCLIIEYGITFCLCRTCSWRFYIGTEKQKPPKKEKPVKSTPVYDLPWTEASSALRSFLIVFSPEAETLEELNIRIDNALTQIADLEEQQDESNQSNKEKPK